MVTLHNVVDTRTGVAYSEVICHDRDAKYFVPVVKDSITNE